MFRRSMRRDERGVVLVLFAISITMMLTLAALVLGSSVGYTAVRKAQNAVDSSAAAATGTLEAVRKGEAVPAEVLATAVDVAEDNGATPGSVNCSVVTAQYALTRSAGDIIGDCSAGNVTSPDAAGVRVSAEDSRDVPFASFVDRQTISATATAAATIQPVRETRIRTPFLVCATAPGHGETPLLHADPSSRTGWRVNSAAVGNQIMLHDNGSHMRDGGRDCGEGSWHGLADESQGKTVPSSNRNDPEDWWMVKPGSTVGWIPSLLADSDGCDREDKVGCKLILPLCTDGAPDGNGRNFRLFCPAMAVFEITYAGVGQNPCGGTKHGVCARLTDGGVPLSGRGEADTPELTDLTRVRLVE